MDAVRPCGLVTTAQLFDDMQVRMLKEVQDLIRSEAIKVPGFSVPKESQGQRVDVAQESQEFASTLKFLKVAADGTLIVPCDSEVSSTHSSAAVFKCLSDIRESAKPCEAIDSWIFVVCWVSWVCQWVWMEMGNGKSIKRSID